MANKITGSTDTSGNVSIRQALGKGVLLVGVTDVTEPTYGTIFGISNIADASTYFGTSSPMIEITRVLIANGVSTIKGICVSEYGEGKTYTSKADAYSASFTKSLEDSDIGAILLDDHDATIVARLSAHLDVAEAEDIFRYSAIGGQAGVSIQDIATLSESVNHKRIFIAAPNVVDSNNTEKSGVYTAACIVSAIVTETDDPALPLNGVQMKGYNGVSKVLLSADITALVNAGVIPLYMSNGLPTIHRLVTSYTKDSDGAADTIWQEGTTVFIADDVLASVEVRLRANYKRTKNVVRILDAIRTDVIDVLNNKDGLEIIQDFDESTVSVTKDPSDTYGALVDYEFKVVTPLYTITIKQHMKI